MPQSVESKRDNQIRHLSSIPVLHFQLLTYGCKMVWSGLGEQANDFGNKNSREVLKQLKSERRKEYDILFHESMTASWLEADFGEQVWHFVDAGLRGLFEHAKRASSAAASAKRHTGCELVRKSRLAAING